jgi:hypothetical protein
MKKLIESNGNKTATRTLGSTGGQMTDQMRNAIPSKIIVSSDLNLFKKG